MKEVAIEDKLFELFISEEDIQSRMRILSYEINEHYENTYEEPVHVIVMMNGAFFFAADLIRNLDFPLHMYFVKSSSYVGMDSAGEVNFQLPEDMILKDKSVLIVEDIVDTGNTFQHFLKNIIQDKPRDLKICSLLVKNKNPEIVAKVDFAGFHIEDPFVIGYGMDLNGKGRDFKDIYVLKQNK
jgi:hypoxanthine phosphoribosyltransferase